MADLYQDELEAIRKDIEELNRAARRA